MNPWRPLFAFCILLFTSFASHAQYDQSKISKKSIQIYNQALEKLGYGEYEDAVLLLKEALQHDNNYLDAMLSLAGVFGELKQHQLSVTTYEQAFALDSNYTSEYRLPYAINLAGLGQFDKALNSINALLSKTNLNTGTRKAAEYRRKTFQFAVDFAKAHPEPYDFKPQNLGDAINTKESEYFPSLTISGNELIFTRLLNNNNEDFFYSTKENGKWQKAYRLNGSINTPDNEGAQNISQDGTVLVFTGCNRPDGLGSCDLYMSYQSKNGWSEAINMGEPINSDQWDSQPSLSPDKKDIYFSSRRIGGYGGSDLYVSHLQANGKWGRPENLGSDINSIGDETEPFIHADNQTLYFVSNGLPGYGEADIFVCRKGPDGKWGKPQNLGYPINTINVDGTLVVASDGKTAYFSSNRADSKGGSDIYSFEMRPDMRPATTLWVKGKVFDKKTNAGLPSTVELIDINTKRVISKLQTDETGNYLVTLPLGKDYVFNVSRRGYLFYSDNFFLKDKAPDSTYQKDIPLQPIEVNASVVLKNIFYDVNKYELKPQSQVELDRVVQLLTDNPTVKIQLEGHTDNVGSAAENMKLSENRAKAATNYLLSKGIRAERLVAKGFGATQPLAINTTEEGRAQNRRTELKIIAR